MQIEEKHHYRFALHHLGFRPFFLAGALFSVAAVALWLWLYRSGAVLPMRVLSPISWHAHEMIYGYTLAVVAGFLLTAVSNWTGVRTLNGAPLIGLALVWLAARLMPLFGDAALIPMAVLDLSFLTALSAAVLHPILKARQWPQIGVWSKLALLLVSNALFYLGLFGLLENGVQWGIYSGLYLIVSLILLMLRRVLPFFIERGVDEKITLTNRAWVDVSSLVLMLAFWVVEVFLVLPRTSALLAVLLFLLHGLRMIDWHTPGIWRKPLLWVLYLGYGWVTAGFALIALARFGALNPWLAVHAFAYGGIGMVTLGMMARVALGHTGRNVFEPPAVVTPMFLLLLAGALARVVAPLLAPQIYLVWMETAQLLWIVAFALFTIVYAPFLVLPRIDGRYG
jgi:uncharacterized protein involved in response to NO